MKPLLPAILAFIILPLTLIAGEVQQLKGSKALLTIDEGEVQVGKQFYIINSEGKKIGLIEIKQVKAGKAIAEILKGRGEVGSSIQARGTPTASSPSESQNTKGKSNSSSRGKRAIGFLLGSASNSLAMDIGPTTGTNAGARESAKLTGTSFSLKAFGDYDLSSLFTFRAAAGLETLAAKGTLGSAFCGNVDTTACSISFNYFALEGSAHLNYLTGKTRAWLGLGYSFLLQMSSTNNIPNLQTAGSSNNMLLVSTGVDFTISPTTFIPVVIEVGSFLGTSDVKVSAVYLRAGYGFSF